MKDSGHSFSSYFKRAANPLLVLALLKERPMYGYEISYEIDLRSKGQFAISVLYPILYNLKGKGFIEDGGVEIADGRARSYYRITGAGIEYLDNTLKEFSELYEAFLKITHS